MTAPARLRDVLAHLPPGTTRLVLRHERRARFRWLSLLELTLKLGFVVVLCACLLIVALAAAVLSEGDADLGGLDPVSILRVRFYHRWHELVLVALAADGSVLAEAAHAPADEREGRAAAASVLAAADRDGLVVVETLGGAVAETLEAWYGGQPLLAHPEVRDAARSADALRRAGYEVRAGDDRVQVVKPEGRRSALWAFFRLGVELVLMPLLFWQAAYRHGVRETWRDLSGVAPGRWVLSVGRDGRLATHRERAGEVEPGVDLDGRDLLGIAWSATLAYDPDVTRREPSLRLVGRDQTHVLREGLPAAEGRALRDFTLATALESWAGIPSTTTRPTRCPYCGNLYVFSPGTGCPSCGAHPDRMA